MAREDAALARLLAGLGAVENGRALDVGCGVGRGVFVLLGFVDAALGVDRSLARVRRARNVAATQADFFLPAPPDTGLREIPIELERLDRDGADFAAADAESLPLVDACMDVVVLRSGDGEGPWDEPVLVLREALRVLTPAGLLIVEGGGASLEATCERVGEEDGFTAWRRT
jgi:SAM-dependent methyltransferase